MSTPTSFSQVLFALVLLARFPAAFSVADEPQPDKASLLAELEAAKKKATQQTYALQYHFEPGEEIRWKVTHLSTVETTIKGNTRTDKMRSVSTKLWKVDSVDAQGNATFVHQVENADMWQKSSEQQEIRFNSETDKTPHVVYRDAAASIGVPLATVTLDPQGGIVKREDARPQFNPGIGELAIPLPQVPVKIGSQWSVPDELRVRMPDGRVKRIQTRQLYTLEKVQTGVATISVDSQVLTPVNDAKLQSQLVQRLRRGTVRFDVDAGRLLSLEMNWDEQVLGFSGSDSLMKYLARYTEELVTARDAAAETAAAEPADDTVRGDRNEKPALRR